MKAIAAALAVLVILGSCTTSKHLQKSQIKTSEQSTQQTVTNTHTEDKSVTTVTAECDTTVTVPGAKVQSESTGVTTVVETDEGTLTARYDPVKNVIKQSFTPKPKQVPVKFKKITQVASNIVQDVSVVKDSTGAKTTVEKSKEVEKKTSWFWLYVAIIAVVLVGLYFLNRKLKFVKLPF